MNLKSPNNQINIHVNKTNKKKKNKIKTGKSEQYMEPKV